LAKELRDPLVPGLVAIRGLLGAGKNRLEIKPGHAVLIMRPGGPEILGPGLHEIKIDYGPTVLCWFHTGPLVGKPFTCILPITEGSLSDGYFMAVICRFKLMIWSPWEFLKAFLQNRHELSIQELWERVKGIVRSSLAKSVASCRHEDVNDPYFQDYLAHSINLSLAEVGLRTSGFEVVEKVLRGPFSNQEELLNDLRRSLPSPGPEGASIRLSEKLELIRKKPWLLVKPERGPNEWKENWISFWKGFLEDWMKVNRRFHVSLEELSKMEPFSRMRPEHLAEVVEALGHGSHVISRDLLDELCSLMPDWVRKTGLYVLNKELLVDLGFSIHEASELLRELVARGVFEWTRPGEEAVLKI